MGSMGRICKNPDYPSAGQAFASRPLGGQKRCCDKGLRYEAQVLTYIDPLNSFYLADGVAYAPDAFSQSRHKTNSSGLADATTERSQILAMSKLPDRLDKRPPASSRISAPAA